MIPTFKSRSSFKPSLSTAICCAVALLSPVMAAADPAPVTNAHSAQVSPQQFQTHVKNLQELLQACRADVASCDAAKVGDDDAVDAQHFQMRWEWLRDALKDAHSAKPADRATLLQNVETRLNEIAEENGTPVDTKRAAQFAKARADADRILNSAEFDTVQQQSWWDRKVASVALWVQRALGGMAALGSIWPWLGQLLEWLLFGGAAIGLLFFVQRSLQRQRLAVALSAQGEELAWKRGSTDWATQAESSARDGDWRDAVHCLYWATIVMLEGRRAWRHNPARTPREYVRLLKPGSAQRNELRGLTQIFERLWYGLRDAGPGDYEKARSLYESLRDKASTGAA